MSARSIPTSSSVPPEIVHVDSRERETEAPGEPEEITVVTVRGLTPGPLPALRPGRRHARWLPVVK